MNLKPLIPILLSFVCLSYPLSEFKKSYNLAKDGLMEDAVITAYEPKVLGGGAGRRFVEDWYVISYGSTSSKVLLGTRSVAVGEGFDKMMSSPPSNIGDRLSVLYIPQNPGVMRVNPVSRSSFPLYNTHNDIALFYLMKIMALILIILAVSMYRSDSRKKA